MMDAITAWILLSIGQAIAANDARLEAYATLNQAAAAAAAADDAGAPPSAVPHAGHDQVDNLVLFLVAVVPLSIFALFWTGVAVGVRYASRPAAAGGKGAS